MPWQRLVDGADAARRAAGGASRIAMGVLVGAVQQGAGLAVPLAFAGVVFVLLQVLAPIHQAIGANLGDRTAAWLYDRLTEACVRPPGMAPPRRPEARRAT